MNKLETVIVDSREKKPLEFKGHPILNAKLNVGDYSLKGLEKHAVVERKSIPDLWGTLSMKANRERFEKELQRAKDAETSLWIVVEGTARDIVNGNAYSNLSGYYLLDLIHDMCFTHGCRFTLAGNRAEASVLTLSILRGAASAHMRRRDR